MTEDFKYLEELIKEHPECDITENQQYIIAGINTILNMKCKLGHIYCACISESECTVCKEIYIKKRNNFINKEKKRIYNEEFDICLNSIKNLEVSPFLEFENYKIYYLRNRYILCNDEYISYTESYKHDSIYRIIEYITKYKDMCENNITYGYFIDNCESNWP